MEWKQVRGGLRQRLFMMVRVNKPTPKSFKGVKKEGLWLIMVNMYELFSLLLKDCNTQE